MELDIHLAEISQVLHNISEAEKTGGGLTAIQFDLKKVIQAVNYLLETSTLKGE